MISPIYYRKIDAFVLFILLFFIHFNCFALNEYKISPAEPDLIGELVLTETISKTPSDLARAYIADITK